jgi:hypothetical protein
MKVGTTARVGLQEGRKAGMSKEEEPGSSKRRAKVTKKEEEPEYSRRKSQSFQKEEEPRYPRSNKSQGVQGGRRAKVTKK